MRGDHQSPHWGVRGDFFPQDECLWGSLSSAGDGVLGPPSVGGAGWDGIGYRQGVILGFHFLGHLGSDPRCCHHTSHLALWASIRRAFRSPQQTPRRLPEGFPEGLPDGLQQGSQKASQSNRGEFCKGEVPSLFHLSSKQFRPSAMNVLGIGRLSNFPNRLLR